jgi:hypothetical protein
VDRATWKAIERWWAEKLGGVRVPITGRSRGSAPDVAHDRWAVEIKAGRVMSARMQEGMVQAVAAAREGQIPLVGITQAIGPGHPRQHYVLMRFDDWQRVVDYEGESYE